MSGVVFVNSLVAKATRIPPPSKPMSARGDRSGDWLGPRAKGFSSFARELSGPEAVAVDNRRSHRLDDGICGAHFQVRSARREARAAGEQFCGDIHRGLLPRHRYAGERRGPRSLASGFLIKGRLSTPGACSISSSAPDDARTRAYVAASIEGKNSNT